VVPSSTHFFLDLTTFQLYPECITETYFSLLGATTTEQVLQPVDSTNRPFKLFRTLGSTSDELIHHEQDESYFIDVSTTRSEACDEPK